MKSGLLMSTPSASQATLMPRPVTRLCACGVLLVENAVLVSCRASGSSSGLAGSVGQTDGDTAVGVADDGAAAGAAAGLLICRSGYTAATVGSAAMSASWVLSTVAENPFS